VAKRRLSKMIRLYSESEYGNLEIRGRIGEFALEHTDSIQKVTLLYHALWSFNVFYIYIK
jgi:hypothetical protein